MALFWSIKNLSPLLSGTGSTRCTFFPLPLKSLPQACKAAGSTGFLGLLAKSRSGIARACGEYTKAVQPATKTSSPLTKSCEFRC